MSLLLKKLLIIALFITTASFTYAGVQVQLYDSSLVIDPAVTEAMTQADMDSLLAGHPMLHEGYMVQITEKQRVYRDHTFDLYLVLALVLVFGIMRFGNPRYFQYLLRAFRSPSFGNQQLKDQMSTAVIPNLLMNLFFAVSGGIYLYYLLRLNYPQLTGDYHPSVYVLLLAIALGGVYMTKYIVMRFSGWAFNVRVIISHYMYNVFLINKILSITLLPFILLMAFMQKDVAVPAMILSFFVIALLLINRYIRSWQVLGGFFQYSKFHFFTYLCASELLPMALLTKLLIRSM